MAGRCWPMGAGRLPHVGLNPGAVHPTIRAARCSRSDQEASMTAIYLAAGQRTPFLKVGGAFSHLDAIALSLPVVRAMMARLNAQKPDFTVWGTVIPNLTWSNIAREVMLDAGMDPTIRACSTVMACSTSMIGVFEAAGIIDGQSRNLALVGGVESMSRVQIGLGQNLSDWLRGFQGARSIGDKFKHLAR